jgi:heat shock protein 5
MARSSRSNRSTWSIALYLFMVIVAGLMLAMPARAEETDSNAVTGPVIGIDLGTTYSCVGIMRNGKVDILVNDQGKSAATCLWPNNSWQVFSTGNRITPSWVAFTDDERLVGDAAKNQFASNPERTIFDVVSCTSRFVHLQLLTTSAEASHRSEVQG